MSDLDLALREAGSDLHLRTPLADVVSRGTRLRRRRRGVRLGVGAVALVTVGGVVSVALPSGSSPLPTAEAGWGPDMVNLSGTDLAAADAQCRAAFQDMDPTVPAGVTPMAADTRGGTSVLIYQFDEFVNTCSTATIEGEPSASFLSSGTPWNTMILPGHHFHWLTGGGTRPPHSFKEIEGGQVDDPVTDGLEVLRVTDDVARLVLHVAGLDFEARVGDGLAVSWLPQGALDSEIRAATVTAYDAEGNELESGLLYYPDPRPGL